MQIMQPENLLRLRILGIQSHGDLGPVFLCCLELLTFHCLRMWQPICVE